MGISSRSNSSVVFLCLLYVVAAAVSLYKSVSCLQTMDRNRKEKGKLVDRLQPAQFYKMYLPFEQRNYPRRPINFTSLPEKYQSEIIQRQPTVTIVKMAFTTSNCLKAVARILSQIRDVALLEKVINFFQENYPENQSAICSLMVRCRRSYREKHNYTSIEYGSMRKFYLHTMDRYEERNSHFSHLLSDELKCEIRDRLDHLRSVTKKYIIEQKWELQNSRGPATIDVNPLPELLITEIIKKSSFVVLTRLWRSCKRVENLVLNYTTHTPKISWYFMIPSGAPVFRPMPVRIKRKILWDKCILEAVLECLTYSRDRIALLRDDSLKREIEQFVKERQTLDIFWSRRKKPTKADWKLWGYCHAKSPFRCTYINTREHLFNKSVTE